MAGRRYTTCRPFDYGGTYQSLLDRISEERLDLYRRLKFRGGLLQRAFVRREVFR